MGTPCPIVLVNLLSHPQTNTEGSLRDKQLSVDVCVRFSPTPRRQAHVFLYVSNGCHFSLGGVSKMACCQTMPYPPPPFLLLTSNSHKEARTRLYCFAYALIKTWDFFFFFTTVAFVINEFMNRMHNRGFCREGITYSWCLCVDGLGEDCWWFYCSVYTLRDKMSPAEKTRKVNWNGRT